MSRKRINSRDLWKRDLRSTHWHKVFSGKSPDFFAQLRVHSPWVKRTIWKSNAWVAKVKELPHYVLLPSNVFSSLHPTLNKRREKKNRKNCTINLADSMWNFMNRSIQPELSKWKNPCSRRNSSCPKYEILRCRRRVVRLSLFLLARSPGFSNGQRIAGNAREIQKVFKIKLKLGETLGAGKRLLLDAVDPNAARKQNVAHPLLAQDRRHEIRRSHGELITDPVEIRLVRHGPHGRRQPVPRPVRARRQGRRVSVLLQLLVPLYRHPRPHWRPGQNRHKLQPSSHKLVTQLRRLLPRFDVWKLDDHHQTLDLQSDSVQHGMSHLT